MVVDRQSDESQTRLGLHIAPAWPIKGHERPYRPYLYIPDG
jgi:hypothetical protein